MPLQSSEGAIYGVTGQETMMEGVAESKQFSPAYLGFDVYNNHLRAR